MATTYAVDLLFQTQGLGKLDKVSRQLQGIDGTAKKLKGKNPFEGAERGATRVGAAATTAGQRMQSAFTKAGKGAGALMGRLRGLQGMLVSLGVGAALGKSFSDASSLESAQTRINTLVKNYGQLDGIQEVATRSAEKFRISQTESLTALTDLGNRLGAQGASLKDIENIYEGFNTLLVNNKVEAAQAASATLQLNQALGSGRLAGEEFNAINEATPQLLDEVARVMGVSRGELKQLAADGKISSKVLIQALTNIRTKGAADLEKSFSGAYGATRDFNKAVSDFSATIGTELLPALVPLIQGATGLLKTFGQLPGPIKTAAAGVAGLVASFVLIAPALPALQGAVVAIKGIGIAGAIALGKIALIAAAVIGIGLAIKTLYDKWEPFRRAVFATQEFFRGFVISLQQQFTQTTKVWADRINAFGKFFSDIWKGIGDFFRGVAQFFVDKWNAVTQNFSDELGVVGQYFSGVWNGVVKFFGGVIETLKGQWRSFIEFVVNSATGPVGIALKAAGINIGKSVADGIANGIGAFKGGLPQLKLPTPPKKSRPSFGGLTGLSDLDGSGSGSGDGKGRSGGRKSAGTVIELLTGDRSSPFYRADHGGSNYHIHIAFASPAERKFAEEVLRSKGIQIGSTTGGKHAPGSYHYSGQAIDIPGSQVPVGAEDILSREVLSILKGADFGGLLGEKAGGMKDVMAEWRQELDRIKEKQEQLTRSMVDDQRQIAENLKVRKADYQLETQLLQLEVDKGKEFADTTREINRLVMEGMPFGEAYDLVNANKQAKELLETMNSKVDYQKQLWEGVGQTVKGALVDTIQQAIKGTADLSDILSNLASQLGGMFLNAGFSMLGQGLRLPGFAAGGRPAVGQVSIVGERGPELFIPDSAGTIVPNHQAAPVMSRFGPDRGGNFTYSPSITAMDMGGQKWVTVEQMNEVVNQGMQVAARQGAEGGYARTMNGLKNSRSARARIAI